MKFSEIKTAVIRRLKRLVRFKNTYFYAVTYNFDGKTIAGYGTFETSEKVTTYFLNNLTAELKADNDWTAVSLTSLSKI